MLFWHCVLPAASRTFCTAGTKSAIKIAMIAITTSNSMRVKPERLCGRGRFMRDLQSKVAVVDGVAVHAVAKVVECRLTDVPGDSANGTVGHQRVHAGWVGPAEVAANSRAGKTGVGVSPVVAAGIAI